jgi:hypothetical protein
MKRITFLLFTCIAAETYSQITIDNLPQAGDSVRTTFGGLTTVNTDPGFINQLWDYSTLQDSGTITENFITVEQANPTFAISFGPSSPNSCDFALPAPLPIPATVLENLTSFSGVTLDNNFEFYQRETNGLFQDGFGFNVNGVALPVVYSNPDQIIPFPIQMETGAIINYSFSTEIPGAFSWICNANRVSEVDGEGTLILPYATFENVYRLRSELTSENLITISSDILPIPPVEYPFTRSTKNYLYFAPGDGWPILDITYSLAGSTAKYRANSNDGVTGTAPKYITNFLSYPNPASDAIQIRFDKNNCSNLTFELFDMYGRIVYSKTTEIQGNEVNETLPLSNSHLSNGQYWLKITPDNNAPVVKPVCIQNP